MILAVPEAADPGSYADAFLKIWKGAGWQTMLGLALVFLIYKFLDAWGKKGK